MKCIILKVLFILALAVVVTKPGAQTRSDSSYVRFLTGVFLLNGTTTLSESIKAEKYIELVKITGISADTAVKYLSAMRQRPQEWKELHNQIKNELSIQQNSQNIPSKKE